MTDDLDRVAAVATKRASPSRSGCGLLILRLARASGMRLGAALADIEMRPHEFAVLDRLAEAGPLSQQALGQALRIHPSNLVALLDELESAGEIVRPRDPADRRRYLLELTPAGRDRLAGAKRATERVERDLLEPLTPGERAQLHAYLRRLTSHACSSRTRASC